MKTWAWMLGGLIVWAMHFLGVYALSSIADVVVTADDARWRMAGLVFSGICVVIAGALLWTAARRLRRRTPLFPDQMAALGAGVSLIAIVWQALPTLIGH